MQTLRLGLPAATAALLALAAPLAWSAGFGNPGASAVLGQALDFAVPLRLDPGDSIEPRCVSAKVTVGDRELPANMVGTVIEMTGMASARIRVLTTVTIDEPVVGVLLDVGCQSRLSRRFVVLADPPGLFDVAPPTAKPMTPVQVALPAAEPVMAAASDVQRPARTPTAETVRRPARAAVPPTSAREGRSERRQARTERARSEPGRSPNRRETTMAAAPRLVLDASPRDAEVTAAEMVAVEQALQAVADAASAVRVAQRAASAAEERAQGLARTADQLRAEAQAQRDAAATMRERLAQSESLSNWVWPMMVGLLLLGGLAGWLSWQLAALRREQRLGWQLAQEQAAAAALADTPDEPMAASRSVVMPAAASKPLVASPAVRPRTPSNPAWPPPAPAAAPLPAVPDTVAVSDFAPSTQGEVADLAEREPLPAMQRTLPLPPAPPVQTPLSAGEGPLRDLTIEELIDLEQQAEFFIVLGQDEAAIDLLVEHARTTGGSSPLPYLKLLEIYQRRGDHEAYERTRGRFNQRFNAYAEEWGQGLQQGRGLEDYPGVLPRLAQVWARPLDAMAELEALLFRKSRGELFDLPAYREVLFLYALARDLLDREAADTGNVDLLLPLADGGDFGATSPHPYFGLDHDSVFDRNTVEDRPTSPVDLDLSQGESPTRIVDSLAASRPPGGPER